MAYELKFIDLPAEISVSSKISIKMHISYLWKSLIMHYHFNERFISGKNFNISNLRDENHFPMRKLFTQDLS